MRKCPFCEEKIQDDAKKCKHCGEWLTERQTVATETKESSSFMQWFVSILLILVSVSIIKVSPFW